MGLCSTQSLFVHGLDEYSLGFILSYALDRSTLGLLFVYLFFQGKLMNDTFLRPRILFVHAYLPLVDFHTTMHILENTYPPLETVVITCQDQKTEVNATPFKIADNQTPIIGIIEQNNFINESLHVIGQQFDRIEEKIVERTVSIEKPASEKSVFVKTEKPLIDLPSQREKVMFKTSQSKMLEVVDKILSDLKVKTEGTSRNTTCTISKKEKKLFLMNILKLILFLLFLLERFSVMIF